MEAIQPEDNIPVSSTGQWKVIQLYSTLMKKWKQGTFHFIKIKVLYSAASLALLAESVGLFICLLDRKQAKLAKFNEPNK